MYTPMGEGKIIIDDADNFWNFCDHLAEIAMMEPVVDTIEWHVDGTKLVSDVTFDYDEEGDEYMLVGLITNNSRVYAEIDDGTYGNLQGLRVYTGRTEDDR